MNTTLSTLSPRVAARRSQAQSQSVTSTSAEELVAAPSAENPAQAAATDPLPDVQARLGESQALAELIEQARHHDRRARSMLCERLLPFFHRVVAKLSFRFGRVTSETIRQESLDMVQYVACALLEDLDLPGGVLARWRPEQGPLEAWLRPFVTCRALDCLRKRKRPLAELGFGEHLPQALEQDLLSLHRALPGAMVQIEQRDALAKLCERILTEPHLGKEALTLLERLFWLEEDREDVAKSMGLKRNTLDVRVKRIREHLGRLCDELGIPFGQT